MAGVENPAPMSLICQTSLGPPLDHSLSNPFSSEMPSRLGPRHWGQSAAWLACAKSNEGKAAAMRALNRLHGLHGLHEFMGGGGVGFGGFWWDVVGVGWIG